MDLQTGQAKTSECTPRQSPIGDAISQLNRNVTELENVAKDFESILAAVITPPEPEQKENKPKAEGNSSLESAILNECNRLDDIIGYLRRIQSRVQL